MKQIIQNIRTGKTTFEDVPVPKLRKGCVLIKTNKTLVSLGTERMLVAFGKAHLLKKVFIDRSRTLEALRMIRQKGLNKALKAIWYKLHESIALGYSNVGVVVGIGEGVLGLQIGDRVASNGSHAEYTCVPRNLVAKIPVNVSDSAATFTVMGSISLNGIRLLNPTLGESIVVIGLGVLGLLTVKLLLINGCQVIGIDKNPEQLALGRSLGILCLNSVDFNLEDTINDKVGFNGVDGVIITASSRSDEILSLSCRLLKIRGTIILVGVVGSNFDRTAMYKKEITLKVARSYGPGRYDQNYESGGQDYPFAFVRWTENRNFQTVLDLIDQQKLKVDDLISETLPVQHYAKIYDNIASNTSLGIVFSYEDSSDIQHTILIQQRSFASRKGTIGIIGAGNFISRTAMPYFKNEHVKYVISANGLSAIAIAKKYQVGLAGTDYQVVLQDSEVDLVVIATRHDLHASLLLEAMKYPKHIFVEKPLCIYPSELEEIEKAWQVSPALSIQMGFNRRFSPFTLRMKSLLGNAPMQVTATMNAGQIPVDSWVHDRNVGGGRIIGEACHCIDLIGFLTGSKATAVCANALGNSFSNTTDNVTILIQYENGSTGVVNYFSDGHTEYQKEKIEVYSLGRVLILDDFKKLRGYGFKNFSSKWTWQDKGHQNQFRILLDTVKKGSAPCMSFEEIVNTTRVGFAALESLEKKAWITIPL